MYAKRLYGAKNTVTKVLTDMHNKIQKRVC